MGGAQGTHIFVDTDAARSDVETLRAIAKDHLKIVRDLELVPPDIEPTWHATCSPSRMLEIQEHFNGFAAVSEMIEGVATAILEAVSTVERAEASSANYAETLARLKSDYKRRQAQYQKDAEEGKIPFGQHSDRWIAASPEHSKADAEEAMKLQGYGPEGNGPQPGTAEVGPDSARDLMMTGEGLVDGKGHLVYDTNGNKVMPNGNLVDPQGNIVGNRYGVVNADGNIVNNRGEIVRLANGDPVDARGNVTDYYTGLPRGNLYGTVDDQGNVRDQSGRMIIYHDGNRVDASGNVIDRFSGKVIKNVNDEEVDRKYWH